VSASELPEGITVIDTYEIEFIQTPERENMIAKYMAAHGVTEKDARLATLAHDAYMAGAKRGYQAGYKDAATERCGKDT
jgi:hypothetical protein